MSPSITELQKRIAEIQSQVSTVPTEPAKLEPNLDIKDLVRDVIREELRTLKDSTIVQPEPVIEPVKELSILESIGKNLTEDEQLWLSKVDVLQNLGKKLPLYFQTEDGKTALKTFLTYFRGFYET